MPTLDAHVKVGTFVWDTGSSNKTVTGVGFTPKALVIFASMRSSLDSWSEELMLSVGITDATFANQRTKFLAAGWDKVAFFTMRNQIDVITGAVLYEITGFGTLIAQTAALSFNSDGFVLDPSGGFVTTNGIYGYIAFGGSDCQVSHGSTAWSTSASSQSVTTPGFRPSLVMLTQATNVAANQSGNFSIGWCDGSNRNIANSVWQKSTWSGASATANKSYGSTSSALVVHNNSTGAIAGEASCALTATGFDLAWSTVNATAGAFGWLAVYGIPMHVGSFDQPSATGLQRVPASGSLDIDPSAVVFQSSTLVAGAGLTANLRLSFGLANDSVSWGVLNVDNDATAYFNFRTNRYQSSDPITLGIPTGAAAGTINARASLSSLGVGTFSVNWESADATARQVMFAAFGGPTETDFGTLPQQSGEVIGLSWVELTHVDSAGADETFLWAPVDLTDPSTYYGGFKEGRVLGFGEINRGLSDKRGQYESAEWTWVQSDTDRLVRGMLDNVNQRNFLNKMALIRMIDDEGRRAFRKPRLLVRGIVRDVRPRSPLLAEFLARDFLASKLGLADKDRQFPQRLLSRADFDDLPATTVGKPVPIIYGTHDESGSSNPAPTLTGTPSLGAYVDGIQVFGFAPLTSGAAVPTGVAAVAAAGGTVATSVPDAKYGVWVTAVDSSGRETDPDCYYVNQAGLGSRQTFPANVVTVTVAAGEKIQVSWSAAAGAVKYRVYMGYYYYGAGPTQWLEVTAPTTSCEFTTSPDWGIPPTSANITAGAQVQNWFERHEYAVSAVYSTGETALSEFGTVWWGGFRRNYRVEWTAPTVAPLHYHIYRRDPYGTWTRRWKVLVGTTHFDDDNLDTGVTYIDDAPQPSGAVPLVYAGKVVDSSGFMQWHRFVVAAHAVKEITSVFQGGVQVHTGNYGVTFAVPGQTGYSTYFANTGNPQYVDINGNRYTCVMVRGPQGDAAADGTQPLSVNVKGVEDTGDGTGTLVDDLADIYEHLVVNWLLQSYLSGAWLTAPDWPTDVDGTVVSQVDSASFAALKALHNSRLAAGYEGAVVFGANGESLTLRELIARMNLSCDCRAGFNRNSQFFVVGLDLSTASLAAAKNYTQTNDMVLSSFNTELETRDIENVVTYSFHRRYNLQTVSTPWAYEDQETRDQESIDDLGGDERFGAELELHAVRSSVVAYDIAARRLAYYKRAPIRVTFVTNLKGLATELGDVITVDHIGGLAAAGWTGRPLVVLRHVTNPSRYTVRLECHDIFGLYGNPAQAESLAVHLGEGALVQRGQLPSDSVGVRLGEAVVLVKTP